MKGILTWYLLVTCSNLLLTFGGPLPPDQGKDSGSDSKAIKTSSSGFYKTTLASKIAIEIPPKKESIKFGSFYYDENDDELRGKKVLGKIYKRNGEEALARPSGSQQHMASDDDQELQNNDRDEVRTSNDTHNEWIGSPVVNHHEKQEGDDGEARNETNHNTASNGEGEGRVPHPDQISRGDTERHNSEEHVETRGAQNRTAEGSSSGNREESLIPHPDQIGGESSEHENHGPQIQRPSTITPHSSSTLSIHHEEHALEPIEHLNRTVELKSTTTLPLEVPQQAASTLPTEAPAETHRSETESGANIPDHIDSQGEQEGKNTEIPQTEIPAQTLPDNKPIEMTDLNPAEVPNPEEHIKGFATEPHVTTQNMNLLTESHIFPVRTTTEEPPRRLPDIDPGAGTFVEPTDIPKQTDTEQQHESVGETKTTAQPGNVPVVTIRIPDEVLTPIPTEFVPGRLNTHRISTPRQITALPKPSSNSFATDCSNETTSCTTVHSLQTKETSTASTGTTTTKTVTAESSPNTMDSLETGQKSNPTITASHSVRDKANSFQTSNTASYINFTSTTGVERTEESSNQMHTEGINRSLGASTQGTHGMEGSTNSRIMSPSQTGEFYQTTEAISSHMPSHITKIPSSVEIEQVSTYGPRGSTENRFRSMHPTTDVSRTVLWTSLKTTSSNVRGTSYGALTMSSGRTTYPTTHQMSQTSVKDNYHYNISETVNTTLTISPHRRTTNVTHYIFVNGTKKPSSTSKSEIKPSYSIRPSVVTSKSPGQIPTPRPVIPPVFIRLQFRMTMSEFCSEKSKFITELVEIVQTETAQKLKDDQIVFLNSQEMSCIPEYDEIMPPSKMDDEHVRIDLYVIDVKGEIDITLTVNFEKIIVPGFKTLPESHFGEKLVDVKLVQQESPPSQASSEDTSSSSLGSGITVAIIIASVGGFCCCCLIILQIIIHKRHGRRFNNFDSVSAQLSIRSMDSIALGAVPKSRPHSGFFNPGLEYDDQTSNKEPSHLLGYTSLSNFTLDTRGMEHEFEKIPYEMPNLSTVPIGAEDKNRFANVIPYTHTRVKLKTIEDEDTSEYINANYVTGYHGNFKAYIATQAPMTNTMRDFWRMVWEQQSRVILMLVPMDERGQPKCPQYWPEEEGMNGRLKYGDYTIVMKRKDVHQEYITSVLEIKDIENNLIREIRHFWITCWPHDGLPEPISLIKFILDTRVHYEDSGAPVIVHCSPGTGRTGTLIATDICMRSYERKRMVDILNSVHKIRQERAGAVQTKEQYILIYKAVYEYSVIMSSPSISTASSAIALHNML